LNGDERVEIKDITYRGDSVFISILAYDGVLEAKISDDRMEGHLLKILTGVRIPFTAQKSDLPRFNAGAKAAVSMTGKWEITPEKGDGKQVGIFRQGENGCLTGSILTTTGDYRYLEGVVQGTNFFLSAFSGMTPYLIQGEFADSAHFTAKFVTPSGITHFAGERNPDAVLPDPYSFTSLKEGARGIDFSFPNLDGRQISLSDAKFRDKPVIISIMGSWCPNCADEAAFLASWYDANRSRGVEIIGLAFERKDDFEFAKKHLLAFKERYGIGYEILFAGQVGKSGIEKALPALNGFISYPTLIFIDSTGEVRKIHAGFSGPATGQFYDDFKLEFNRTMDELIKN
jgi:thiol-disulfide isomerase/thioredoxin